MDKVLDNTTGFHFTIIDNYILNDASLNALEQIVYVHLKKYSLIANKCFPGINKLAESLNLSPNTIRKTLRNLKEKGFIDIQQRFNSSNEYTLLPYPDYVNEFSKGDKITANEEGIARVIKIYQDNINPVYGSMEREKLLSWFDSFGESADIIIKAIEMAVMQGVRKIKYIESILVKWHELGIKTIDQCESYQKEWEVKRRDRKNGAVDLGKSEESDTAKRYDFSKFGDKEV